MGENFTGNEDKMADEIKENEVEAEGYSFWPTHVLSQAILLLIFGGIVLTFAMLVPIGLSNPVDPLVRPEIVKPPWYFLPLYQFGKYARPTLTALVLPVGGIVLLLWPFIDKRLDEKFGKSFYFSVGSLLLIITVLLGLLGWFSEKTYNFGEQKIAVDTFGIPRVVSPDETLNDESIQTPDSTESESEVGGGSDHEE